jgi:hypothetical protein
MKTILLLLCSVLLFTGCVIYEDDYRRAPRRHYYSDRPRYYRESRPVYREDVYIDARPRHRVYRVDPRYY